MKINRLTNEVSYIKVDYKKMYEDSQRGYFKTSSMNLIPYLSPENETSVFKGIPRSHRFHPTIRALMITGLFRIKYRGASKGNYKRPQAHCHSLYSDSFAIYKR